MGSINIGYSADDIIIFGGLRSKSNYITAMYQQTSRRQLLGNHIQRTKVELHGRRQEQTGPTESLLYIFSTTDIFAHLVQMQHTCNKST